MASADRTAGSSMALADSSRPPDDRLRYLKMKKPAVRWVDRAAARQAPTNPAARAGQKATRMTLRAVGATSMGCACW